jgi:hypothetical protein
MLPTSPSKYSKMSYKYNVPATGIIAMPVRVRKAVDVFESHALITYGDHELSPPAGVRRGHAGGEGAESADGAEKDRAGQAA